MSKRLKTNPNSRGTMGKTYYTYAGKKKALGGISKMFNDLVLIDDEWMDCVNSFFKAKGYSKFLFLIKAIVRETISVELTDAQAWLMLHHITNEGVPTVLRDEESDEDANAATYVAAVAGAVAGAVMTPVDLAYQGVQGVTKKLTGSSKDDLPADNGDTDE